MLINTNNYSSLVLLFLVSEFSSLLLPLFPRTDESDTTPEYASKDEGNCGNPTPPNSGGNICGCTKILLLDGDCIRAPSLGG